MREARKDGGSDRHTDDAESADERGRQGVIAEFREWEQGAQQQFIVLDENEIQDGDAADGGGEDADVFPVDRFRDVRAFVGRQDAPEDQHDGDGLSEADIALVREIGVQRRRPDEEEQGAGKSAERCDELDAVEQGLALQAAEAVRV